MAFDENDMSKMNALAQRAKEIQDEMQKELNELAKKEYNTIVAAGQVKIKMTGDFSVKSVYISPDYISTHSTDQISEALSLAFNNCKYDIDKEKQGIANKYTAISNEEMMKAMGGQNF